jgi:hypothetical protein
MRYAAFASAATIAFLLSSCASAMVDGIPLYGRFHDVSTADVRTAVALVRASAAYPQIYAIEVVSGAEMNLHYARYEDKISQYNRVRFVRGKWRFDERVIGPPRPFKY